MLARVGPGTALAFAATTVTLAAARRAGAAESAGDVVRAGTLVLNAGLWWGFAGVTVFRRPPVRRGPWVQGATLVGVASVAAAAVQPAGAVDIGWPQLLASAAISLASLALAIGALGRLGRCFGVLPDARGLVTGGPYRFVRHPLYVGEIGTFLSIAMAAPTPRNAAGLSALVAAQAARARLEEQTLRIAFPGYAEYAARTPMLIPRISSLTRRRRRAASSDPLAVTAGGR
ncbi:MAG TPA: methyltransferase [Gaiellales bacterium]|nr:methyltransferase [Gaiellales bacterium]